MLLKVIYVVIDFSYNGLFFFINDVIKSKGIDIIELVYGVVVVYVLINDNCLLDIVN